MLILVVLGTGIVRMRHWHCSREGVICKNVVIEVGVAAVGGGLARGHLVAE